MKKAIALWLAVILCFGLISGCKDEAAQKDTQTDAKKTYQTMKFEDWLNEGGGNLYLLDVEDENATISADDFIKIIRSVNLLSSALPTVNGGDTVTRADAFVTIRNFFNIIGDDTYYINLKGYTDMKEQSDEVKSAFNALAGKGVFEKDAPKNKLRPDESVTWGEVVYALNILKIVPDGAYEKELSVAENDDNTVCLWLFDEPTVKHATITDSSKNEKADLAIMSATFERGLYGNALRVVPNGDYSVAYHTFIGAVTNDYMRAPADKNGLRGPAGLWGPTEGPGALLDAMAKKDITVEFWTRIMSVSEGEVTLFDVGQGYDNGFNIIFDYKKGKLTLNNYYGGYFVSAAVDGDKIADGTWHHLAFEASADSKKGEIFIDGKVLTVLITGELEKQPTPDPMVPKNRQLEARDMNKSEDHETRRLKRFNISLGQDRKLSGATMDGYFDEFRISDIVRYTGNFNPPNTLSRNISRNEYALSQEPLLPLLFPSDVMAIKTGDIINLSNRKYVFIDTALFDKVENAKINLNPPEKEEPITGIQTEFIQGSVIEMDGKIYIYSADGYSSEKGDVHLYISDDGLNFKYYGAIMKDVPNTGVVFVDTNPNVPADQKIKYTCWLANRGIYTYYSADGIHFRRNENVGLPLVSGGAAETYYDNQRGIYAQFLKRDSGNRTPTSTRPRGRVSLRFETSDIMQNWPFKRVTTPYYEGWWVPGPTDEGPITMEADDTGEVYRARAIKYQYAPDTYYALSWRLTEQGGLKIRETDLGVSRDGVKWNFFMRSDGIMYLGKEDLQEAITAFGMIHSPNKLYVYGERGGAHGSGGRYPLRFSQRVDGYTSLDAGSTEAQLTSKPMTIDGNSLYVNVKSSGYVKFQLTDEKGVPLKGFTFADCLAVSGDKLDYKVSFKGGALSALKGKVIKVEIKMSNTKLYAMQFR